jgi:DNA modification methylase
VNTPTSKALNVSYLSPLSLKPYARNARTHSKRQLRQIAESIRSFGFNNPVLIDKESSIIAGHGRVEAAKLLGMTEVPTIQLEHMTEAQKQAYILADNRIAEKAGWDKEILAIELQNIMAVDLDFDIMVTGFEMGEIDKLLIGNEEQDDVDEIPEPAELPLARVGDLWQLGDHRLYCGNSLEAASYQALLEGQQAHLIFTDPPYNVPINGHVSGLGKTKHEEFAMASGEMTSGEFTSFLEQVFHQMAINSTDGALHFVCMDWRHMSELLAAGQKVYDELKNLCVWNKDRGGMGALYRSKHELVFLFKSGKEPHTNNVELGKHGRYRTNIWDYPAVNTWKTGAGSELAMHPTVKPVRMIADAIMDCSNRGDLVLDPFGGSGSTLMAAEKTGRKARLIELEPKYVDVIIKRWERLTKQKAVQLACGVKGS